MPEWLWPIYVIAGGIWLYVLIRDGVAEGVYRALKRYEDEESKSSDDMIQIGERVQKERAQKEKEKKENKKGEK